MTKSLRDIIQTPNDMMALRDALRETLNYGYLRSGLKSIVTDPEIDAMLERLVGNKETRALPTNFINTLTAQTLGFHNIHEANNVIGRMKRDTALPFDMQPGETLDIGKVVYLTSSCLENAGHVSQWYLEANGLAYTVNNESEYRQFYPLSERESQYIAEDQILIGRDSDDLHAMTGYTVLIDNKKFLALAHENHYDHNDPIIGDKKTAYGRHVANTQALQAIAKGIGGVVATAMEPEYEDEDENGMLEGHYLSLLCVPFDVAFAVANNYDEWAVYLRLLDNSGDDRIARKVVSKLQEGKTRSEVWHNMNSTEIRAMISTLSSAS